MSAPQILTPPKAAAQLAICVRGLVNRFGAQIVHEKLDLDVRRGEILGVVGGSGTGKSVLLRTIIGLNRPVGGTINVLGTELIGASDKALRALERRWGVLFQDGALFSSLTVAQNVDLVLQEQTDLSPRLRQEIAALKIALVGLPIEAGAKFPSELSGGMRKRAGLARALALDPEILFLDEPTAGLDPIGAAAFDALIKQLNTSLGLTVFLVTHDLDTLHAIVDRVAVLAERRVIRTAPLAELVTDPHPWIQSYFNGPRGRLAAASYGA
jgi:phospholipid/cholesterol/gamma-HCH transport system ATP-binding protein